MTRPTISDAAVRASTGRVWDEWFALLDAAGADAMAHPQIAAYLHERHDLSGWWSQMVTVAYEQARGRRQPHQTPRGYQVGVSKTVPVSVQRLFAAWHDPAARRAWLGDETLTVRRATPAASMRVTWGDQTNVDVTFWDKGAAKSSVQVQHSKLVDRADVETRRAFWRAALTRLAACLRGEPPRP